MIYTKETEKLIKLLTLKDVELKLIEARANGYIVPDKVIEILREIESDYNKMTPEEETKEKDLIDLQQQEQKEKDDNYNN